MLERIHIKGFKSLVDVEVGGLAPLVVIFGPNAAGKSNFLEALQLLSNLGGRPTLDQAFDVPLRGYPVEQFTLPADGLVGLLAQEESTLSIEADLSTAPDGGGRRLDPLRYRVATRIEPRTGVLAVEDEYLTRLSKRGRSPKQLPRIEKDEGRLLIRALGGGSRPAYEDLGLNHTVVSNLQRSGDRFPDFDQLRRELAAWNTYYLDPRVAMREARPPRQVGDIGSRGEWIAPFLYRLKTSKAHQPRFVAILRALRSAIPTMEGLDVELDERRGTLDIVVTQDGTPYSSRILSEGTLRVLALCALAANPWPNALVAFEEPENGVHPRRVDVIANLLRTMARPEGRQVIVSTHSQRLAAHFIRVSREAPAAVTVLRCWQEARETRIAPFASQPLFDEQSIREALAGPEDDDLLEAMLVRGWLDG